MSEKRDFLWVEDEGELVSTVVIPEKAVYDMLKKASLYGEKTWAAFWVRVVIPTRLLNDFRGEL